MEMHKLKLSEWAKLNQVCYRTAWNYFKNGKFDKIHEIVNGKIFIYIHESDYNDMIKPTRKKVIDDIFQKTIEIQTLLKKYEKI